MNDLIREAVETLKKGGLLLYPTDTLWGIGCDATNSKAVQRIYDLKKSENKTGMLVLLDHPDKISLYIQKVPDIAWQLLEVADKPLTLILPDARGLAENLLPPEQTVGIRIPDHAFCQKLIYTLGRPLVSTSANISGIAAPLTFCEIAEEIKAGVDLIIPEKYDINPTRKPSSLIKLGKGGEIEIIRP